MSPKMREWVRRVEESRLKGDRKAYEKVIEEVAHQYVIKNGVFE